MIGSSGIKCSPLRDDLGTISCNSFTSKDPCLAVVGVSRDQSAVGPKAYMIDGAPDPPLCEKINHTLGISIIILKTNTH
jgi:hypothetical protein